MEKMVVAQQSLRVDENKHRLENGEFKSSKLDRFIKLMSFFQVIFQTVIDQVSVLSNFFIRH